MIRIDICLVKIVQRSGEPRIKRHSHPSRFDFILKHQHMSPLANLIWLSWTAFENGSAIRIPLCLCYINHTHNTPSKTSSLSFFTRSKNYRCDANPPPARARNSERRVSPGSVCLSQAGVWADLPQSPKGTE